jgi:hypothetical protein
MGRRASWIPGDERTITRIVRRRRADGRERWLRQRDATFCAPALRSANELERGLPKR